MIGSVTLIDYLIVIQVKLQFLLINDQATCECPWLLIDHWIIVLPEFWLPDEEGIFCSVSTQNTQFSPQQSLGVPEAQLLFTVKCLLETREKLGLCAQPSVSAEWLRTARVGGSQARYKSARALCSPQSVGHSFSA